jgi:hypothetical protein
MSTVTDRFAESNPLYLDEPIEFEKVGMDARLSDNSDTWVQEVMQELMKQHPYLGQFDVMPEMTQVEGDKGYGFGYFAVQNRTEAPATPGGEALAAQAGVTSIKIPIIIKEQKLSTFDVFLQEGKRPYPLTEERVRQAMFRPQLFDTTGKPPGATSMSGQLYPPGRSNTGIATHQSTSTPAMKLGSAKPRFLMEAIGQTINKTDIEKVSTILERNIKVAMALKANEATLPFMQYLAGLQPLESEQIAKVAAESIRPNVIMITRQGDGYHLKMAASNRFAPEETVADRATMSELAGEDMVKEVDSTGVSVVSTDPVVRDIAEDEKAEIIERFGEYRVKTLDGKEVMGWVFPTVLDFDGTQLPMVLFSNGSAASMQEAIAGSFVGAGANVIRGRMKGNGFFYRITSEGTALAFVPGKVLHPFADENGQGVIFESVLGEQARVRLVAGLKAITKIGEGEYAIPGDVRWLPFDGSALVKLMDSPETFSKVASVKQATKMVTIISDGETWSFKGGCGLAKLAHEDTTGLMAPDAMFLGCTLGMDERTALRALGISGQRGQVKVAGCREIQTVHDRYKESQERAKNMWDNLPPRYNLFKEAASLEDATTVDKVLSIGFLNPENVSTFVGYLPEIDQTVSKLAEILVAVRLGLKDIPEVAVKNAMERLDEVAASLKALMYRAAEG